jgi:3-hydroxybutyryl-CoA dehydrogenase
MKIAVYGDDNAYKELIQNNSAAECIRVNDGQQLFGQQADAYFNLSGENISGNVPEKPYFINSVMDTLGEMDASKDTIRFNGWNGFVSKSSWEVAGEMTDQAAEVLSFLGKKFIPVSDEPGLISARVIAMIVNEAFFAEAAAVSTPAEIDTAMKLGTNYPFGPFEWAEKIGLENIFNLLQKLAANDKRYEPAPSLAKKIRQ